MVRNFKFDYCANQMIYFGFILFQIGLEAWQKKREGKTRH